MKYIVCFIFFISCYFVKAQEISLRKGMTITKSVKIKRAVYSINASKDLSTPVILIEGNDITIDFNNATLKGSNSTKQPDEFFGAAILIKNGKNITIKNLNAKGYKVAVIARSIDGLKIENCNFSYNYRQHLNSTQEKEDISDWMSYHHNENEEWLRYGAGMYLRGCNNAIISNCKVTGGQNALMMMECNNGMIFNNDFSFNSGIGIGMYKSSMNKVLYNKVDFNVRGYSHGVYNRGQDSAGILVYDQSNDNLFYKNSVTHGGDGFFLWAGQTTMDTGKGGCNGNIIMDNDFSYAPTNGVEVTFSSNKIIHNRIFECDHGIWGGYSFNSDIKNNQFRNNRIAIAIEHGQNNDIHHNLFGGDKEAIRLWSSKEQSPDWGYAQYRDTRSHSYNIIGNSFNRNSLVFNIMLTDSLNIFGNRVSDCDLLYKIDSTVTNIDSSFNENLADKFSVDSTIDIPVITNPIDAFRGIGKLSGRKSILITEWGPYNFQYPIIWNANPTDTSSTMQFDVLGPKGKWKIVSVKGVKDLSKKTDSFPATFTAQKIKKGRTDIEIVAEYTGSTFTDQFGNKVAANKPYKFIYKKFFQPINFSVGWFKVDSTNPLKGLPLRSSQIPKPFKAEVVDKLDYAWWGGIKGLDGIQHTQFFTQAYGTADSLSGLYELGVTWDDAVRVYVDDKLVIDEWNPSLYKFDESPHKTIKLNFSGGKHEFRVEHVELGGFATLSLTLKKL